MAGFADTDREEQQNPPQPSPTPTGQGRTTLQVGQRRRRRDMSKSKVTRCSIGDGQHTLTLPVGERLHDRGKSPEANQDQSKETPAGKINSGIHGKDTRPKKSKNPPQQRRQATTLAKCGGVAAPSFHARPLGEQGLDLLQLGLKHSLDVVPLIVDLSGDLCLKCSDLRICTFG